MFYASRLAPKADAAAIVANPAGRSVFIRLWTAAACVILGPVNTN
jgi:hypothetical protein